MAGGDGGAGLEVFQVGVSGHSTASDYYTQVQSLLSVQLATSDTPLDSYLAGNSHLPGPASNFSLLHAMVQVLVERAGVEPETIWGLLERWASVPFDEARANDPREFLPFTAALAHGAIAAAMPGFWTQGLARLRGQARDRRWRTREMVAQGLQTMAKANFEAVYGELARWVDGGDPLELRAAVATLAEPALLVMPEQRQAALAMHVNVMERLRKWPVETRKDEEFVALRKGLGYTISVVAAVLPDETFAQMLEWATWNDKDIEREHG